MLFDCLFGGRSLEGVGNGVVWNEVLMVGMADFRSWNVHVEV